jgi:Tol biopolymer transport system component
MTRIATSLTFAVLISTAAGIPVTAATPSPAVSTTIEADQPWIVYQWLSDDGKGLYVVHPDGGGGHRILTDLVTYHPDWSPDGAQLVFEAWPDQERTELWTSAADGRDARRLIACEAEPCLQVNWPAWSPDGTRIVYQRYDHPSGTDYQQDRVSLEVLDIATGERHVVARAPTVGSEYLEYIYPRWSPDGEQVVFTIITFPTPPADPGLGSSIAIVRADGSEVDAPRVLTDPALYGAYADWSPDGERIVFNTHDQGKFEDSTLAANLYTIRPDGTDLTQLTHFGDHGARATQPTWTPDGKRIIFSHITYDPNGQFGGWGLRHIAFVDADGTDLTVLDGQFATHPRLQPGP